MYQLVLTVSVCEVFVLQGGRRWERRMHAAESPEEGKLALLTPAGTNAVEVKTCVNKDQKKSHLMIITDKLF